MTGSFARLQISGGISNSQEFLLNHDVVEIGRAPDNHLILSQESVSRRHARITWDDNRYLITDLGSTDGTRVNNSKLPPGKPWLLANSDVIQIGTCKLRFSTEAIATSSPQLEKTVVAQESFSLPVTSVLAEHSKPVLRVSTAQGSQDFRLEKDLLVLGRDPNSDIVINLPEISARHAQLKQCDGSYEIIDLNSRNGLIYQGRRIAQQLLADGDVLHIGTAVTLSYHDIALPEIAALKQQLNLGGRTTLSLGRDPQNDTVIDHPTVSRFHAQIARQDGSFAIVDLNSSNGTFVNGKRVTGKRCLRPGDSIRIGPCRLVFNFDETLERHDEQGNLRLDALHLKKDVGKGMTLLQDISLSILPREFVAVVGVSGAGKSTLLDALNGFRPATYGTVLVNGTDLYKNFNAYRTEIGYVPQDDIIHLELTVGQALDYAAQLRMPADTTPAERQQRVEEVLADLDMSHRRDVPIKRLSGGQRKRVSMGVELLTKPSLFFLDEATSGLDPGTEAQMMKLLRKLADQGRTILLITHATKNVMTCDQVIFLARGGYIAFLGPPNEALQYFKVKDFDQIYPKVESELTPEEWEARYKRSRQYQRYIVERLRNSENPPVEGRRQQRQQQLPGAEVKHVSFWRQLQILSQRNLAILMRDRASLALMLAIAPILGLLDFFLWPRNVFDTKNGDAQQALMMLFVAAIIAIMVGSLSSMREIVKEMEIYRRERMVSLKIAPYILSKIWLGILVSLYQAAIFVLFKQLAVNMPGGMEAAIALYITLFLATLAGMMMGLLVSAVSPNQNVAPLLIILILIPQITFGGGMLPINALGVPGKIISQVTPSKWAFEPMVTITAMGKDVAEDECFARLSQQERNKLTEAEKTKRCSCLGPNVFKQCQFPGIKDKYTEAVDAQEPQQPKDPGTRPAKPEPTGKCPAFSRCYRDKFDQWEKELKAYEDKVNKYKNEIQGDWKTKYSDWKQKRESAIGEAEGVIRKFHQDYGAMFKVDVVKDWGILGLIMTAVFAMLLPIQKRKDIV
jgi:ABC-type multidrug transport system ATPase subunit